MRYKGQERKEEWRERFEKSLFYFILFFNWIVATMVEENLNLDSPHKREQTISLSYKFLGDLKKGLGLNH